MKSDGAPAVASRPRTEASFGKPQFHPLALVVSQPMNDAQIEEISEGMRRHGGTTPFLRRGEIILDDPNRFKACQRAGVPLVFQEWDGAEALAVVVTRAILPPHSKLSDSQRAAIAVPISDELAAGTIPARQAGLRRGNNNPAAADSKPPQTAFLEKFPVAAQLQQRGLADSCDKSQPNLIAIEEQKRLGRAAEIAAELVGVSPRYVYDARKLRDENRGLFDQVRLGLINLSKARVAASKLTREKSLNEKDISIKRNQPGGDEIIVGDCLEKMSKMPEGIFKLIFGDPPYNLGWKYHADPTHDQLPDSRYLEWTERWMRQCARLLTPEGSMFVLIDSRWQGRFDVTLRNVGLHHRNTIVWHDPFPTHTDARFQPAARFLHYFTRSPKNFTFNADAVRIPSRRDEIEDARRVHDKGIVPHDVWDFPRIVGNAKERVPFEDAPPQVPAGILHRCILAASNEGDRVFDPFTGNGTTWKSARELGRKFTGIERSPKYAAQARQWAGA